jgi:hypothetical protein
MIGTVSTVKNNGWYHNADGDSVLVFVHGVLSSNATAWLNSDSHQNQQYWPALIQSDNRFRNPSIYIWADIIPTLPWVNMASGTVQMSCTDHF